MAILFDSGPAELLRRGHRRAEALALQHYPPVLPLPVLGEFLYGLLWAQVSTEAFSHAQEFLGSFEVLEPDRQTALIYARLRSQSRARGTVIPDPDFWIAALALQHQTRLVTMDRHFEAFPELKPFVLFVEKGAT